MKVSRLLFLLFSLAFFSAQAQTPSDTLAIEGEEDVDTIYVEEEPYVYEQEMIVHTEKRVKFYLSGYVALLRNYNHYIPCTGWSKQLEQYRSTVDPLRSYALGINLSFAPKKIIISGALDYSIMREKFNYTDDEGVVYESNNRFNYVDLSLTGGYWMRRDKKNYSLITSAGLTYNYLIGQKGLVLDVNYADSVTTADASGKFRVHQYGLTVSCKFILRPQSRMKYEIEPYYLGNIATITNDKYPYLQYHNRIGLRFGIMFSI